MNAKSEQASQQIEFRKLVDGRIAGRFIVSKEVAAVVEDLLREKSCERIPHGNCRLVLIWGEVNEEVYQERIRSHGAKPILNRRFPSAREASLHFGVNPNAVTHALNQAKRRKEDVAYVVGVPVCWADAIGGS